MDDPRTEPTERTQEFEAADARRQGSADRMPTPEEETEADHLPPLRPEVAEHFEEMAERGANQQGEGRVAP